MPETDARRQAWLFAAAALILAAAWQWTTVTANYSGNWSALFCTGALQPHPRLVADESVYLFQGSTGYDGQFYHYIAHDPLLRSDLKSYVDNDRFRYRRIFVPLLAYALALGNSRLIDGTYDFVCLLSIGLGVYWSCRVAAQTKLAPAWGLIFLLVPAVAITVDRLVVDATLAAVTAAFLCYRKKPWKIFIVLICAALTRETGFLLIAAYCAWLVRQRQFRWAAAFLLSAMPAAAWYAYVYLVSRGQGLGVPVVPFSAIWMVLLHPWQYPAGTPLVRAVHAADYLALAGLLLAFAQALYCFCLKPRYLSLFAAVLFTSMGLLLRLPEALMSTYDYGRVYTPLLVCLAAVAAQRRRPWLVAPIGMMLPRIAIQLTPQVLGVIRWMTAGKLS